MTPNLPVTYAATSEERTPAGVAAFVRNGWQFSPESSSKYAFDGRDRGTVSVRIANEDGNVTLIIQDDGVGFDETTMEGTSTGFGLTVIGMLVKQLGGTSSITNENGATVLVTFEL